MMDYAMDYAGTLYYVVKIFKNILAGIIVLSIYYLWVQKQYNAPMSCGTRIPHFYHPNIIWHSTLISSLASQYLTHPNRNIGISTQYQYPRYWTFNPIQYLAPQCKHPNEA
jgi:hypothetical protein